MARNNLTPEKVSASAKRARAIHLAAAGHDFNHIAQTVGFSTGREARKQIGIGLKEIQSQAVEEYRSQELYRLDRITLRLWSVIEPWLENGADPSEYPLDNKTLDAINLYMKVSERRAKITGLDTTHVEVTGGKEGSTPVQIQIVQDVERFQRFIAERVAEMQEKALPPAQVSAEVIEENDEYGFSIAELDEYRGRGAENGSASGNGSGVGAGDRTDSTGG